MRTSNFLMGLKRAAIQNLDKLLCFCSCVYSARPTDPRTPSQINTTANAGRPACRVPTGFWEVFRVPSAHEWLCPFRRKCRALRAPCCCCAESSGTCRLCSAPLGVGAVAGRGMSLHLLRAERAVVVCLRDPPCAGEPRTWAGREAVVASGRLGPGWEGPAWAAPSGVTSSEAGAAEGRANRS